MGEVRLELLHLVGVDAILDRAVGEEAPSRLRAQACFDTGTHTVLESYRAGKIYMSGLKAMKQGLR